MSPGRTKGPDEVFCESCGEAIKKDAEICPNCGVRNGSVGGSGGSHGSGQYDTTVSDSWWVGVLAFTAVWVVVFAASSTGSNLGDAAGLATLAAWVGLPIAVNYDMKYVRANSGWDPEEVLWVIMALVPLVNVVAGAVYLYRRHEVLGTP